MTGVNKLDGLVKKVMDILGKSIGRSVVVKRLRNLILFLGGKCSTTSSQPFVLQRYEVSLEGLSNKSLATCLAGGCQVKLHLFSR